MAKFQALRAFWIFTIAVLITVFAITTAVLKGALIGVIIFFVLLGAFFLQGLREIPADPPMRGIPTFWGNYIDVAEDDDTKGGISLHPGRWFFPLAGCLFDFIRYDASEINLEMSVKERTPDSSEILVDPYFTYVVDPKRPVRYILAGDKGIVEDKFTERVDSRLREWISSLSEGPVTWQEAIQSNGLAMDVIIRRLFPEHLEESQKAIQDVLDTIPNGSVITLPMVIKYFTGRPALPEKRPKSKEAEIRTQEYKAKKALDAFKQSNRAEWNTLQDKVRDRIAKIEKVKGGECEFPIENLGIIVKLANLGNIKPTGKTEDAADTVAMAYQTAKVDSIGSDNFQEQVEKFAAAHGGDMVAATEAIQLLRGLKTKSTVEQQFALRADNVDVLRAFLGPMGAALAEWIASKAKPTT